ncbi:MULTISPECIES: flagellin N-terminal helical domain-containing protein [unclassified Janthinobacterium]|uniref:flagellin N-terminal helical domain-containing protein n=1 Tax=unclassified Janthinobacterium TaxID=2610881 RepID=UPI00035D12C3|nr:MULTISPECIES: flagellin [unclassified Janthinobacterium]
MLSLHTNTVALYARSSLARSQGSLSTAMTRLATGYRVNSAMDDAAGLQIATRLRAQTSGMAVAMRNAQNNISMLQTADGALRDGTDLLIRMKDLATLAADASASAQDRNAMQAEFGALSQQLSNISGNTTFGGAKILLGDTSVELAAAGGAAAAAAGALATANALLASAVANDASASTSATVAAVAAAATVAAAASQTAASTLAYSAAATAAAAKGTFSAAVDYQIGATSGDLMSFDFSTRLDAMHAALHAAASTYNTFGIASAGAGAGTDLTLPGSASASIDTLRAALDAVAAARSEMGAVGNRLGRVLGNLSNISDNTRAASGRVMDADFAQESAAMTSSQMLLRAGGSMLQRSNGMSSIIMALLQ